MFSSNSCPSILMCSNVTISFLHPESSCVHEEKEQNLMFTLNVLSCQQYYSNAGKNRFLKSFPTSNTNNFKDLLPLYSVPIKTITGIIQCVFNSHNALINGHKRCEESFNVLPFI